MIYWTVSAAPCNCSGEPVPFSATVPVAHAAGQNEGNAGRTTIIFSDSTWSAPPPSIEPSKAMLHSLAVPGWGQIDNGRRWKAALFFVAEAVCIGGYAYMNYRVKHDDVSDWERDNLRTDRNTFIIYWMGSKLFGLVDAYVDAHLVDFDVSDITPDDLRKDTER